MVGAPPPSPAPAGLYLHFPFCSSRCSYCDFPAVAGRSADIGAYLQALEFEIINFQKALPEQADSLYIGGGTPSLMSARQLSSLLRTVRKRFDLAPDAEITLECNPEQADEERLLAFAEAGVTRLTIGMQSFDDAVLSRAGRRHSAAEAIAAARLACRLEGLQVNADLILGLPGERLERWGERVAAAAAIGTDHLSIYMLETDKDTPLARAINSGQSAIADAERIGSAYLEMLELLEGHGLHQYEISNFAREGRQSRHNLKYWTDVWFGAFGLGAHAYLEGCRRSNHGNIDDYLAALEAGRDPLATLDPWDPGRRLEEAVIMGLRLKAGLDLEALGERYGSDIMTLYLLHSNELFSRLIAE